MHIYIYIYMYVCIYIYIYIYLQAMPDGVASHLALTHRHRQVLAAAAALRIQAAARVRRRRLAAAPSRRQYVHICTSKASKLSTKVHILSPGGAPSCSRLRQQRYSHRRCASTRSGAHRACHRRRSSSRCSGAACWSSSGSRGSSGRSRARERERVAVSGHRVADGRCCTHVREQRTCQCFVKLLVYEAFSY